MIVAKKIGIDLIIFDLDGTLVDSKDDIVNAVNYTLRRHGLKEKKPAEIVSYIGTGSRELLRKSMDNAVGASLDDVLSTFTGYSIKHCADRSVLYPHVKETLEYFCDKKKTVVTNRIRDSAERLLGALGVRGYFDLIAGGDNINCLKPSPCPLDLMINKLDADKRRVIIVGDMEIDISAGRNADILTCAVTYGLGNKEDILKARPDFVIDDMIELKEIID